MLNKTTIDFFRIEPAGLAAFANPFLVGGNHLLGALLTVLAGLVSDRKIACNVVASPNISIPSTRSTAGLIFKCLVSMRAMP